MTKSFKNAKCGKCDFDFTDKCVVTIMPVLRIVDGGLGEVIMPIVFMPMVCPSCKEPMIMVDDGPKVEVPSKQILVPKR